jgi:hypothetical protein
MMVAEFPHARVGITLTTVKYRFIYAFGGRNAQNQVEKKLT